MKSIFIEHEKKKIRKRIILYIEQNTDGTIGGSYFSLLFLVQKLDKRKYTPIIIFYQENELIASFEKAGCQVLLLNKAKRMNLFHNLEKYKKESKFTALYALCIILGTIIQKGINFFIGFIFPAFSCWRIITRMQVDLIHLNNTILRPQEWILASLFSKAKVVAHERGINTTIPHKNRFFARYLEAIICISGAVKKNLINNGFPENKLFLIHNGLDPSKFTVTKSKSKILKKYGLTNNHQIIGVVGNIKPWKGQDIACKALVHVKKRIPQVKCFLIGGSSEGSKKYINYLRDLVIAEGLRDNVIFTGHSYDVQNLINTLNILLHTSILPEPFGRVLLEGMALRKPIITPDIGAGPEIVLHGKTGLVVKSGDPKDFARAVLYMLKNPKRAEEMGEAGRKRLKKHFHINLCVIKIEKIYAELLYK